MTRRVYPEEPREALPLFDILDQEAARVRAEVGMARAAERAEKVEPGWRASALESVRLHALAHETFLAENVAIFVPQEADPRAAGAVFQAARRRGWIRADGFAPANSSNRSAKVRWRSMIYGGAA